jgi:hypothetical protein
MLALAKNTNNITLTNPLAFNLPTLNNIIQKVSVSNTERIFNTIPILKEIGISRIKSWLTKIWAPKLTTNLLTYHYRKTQNFTLLFHLSQIAQNNISLLIFSQISSYPSQIPENTHTIYDILPPNPPISTTNSLRNNKIMFVEQITTANNLDILPWNNIYLRTNRTSRGCIPNWFTQISQQNQLNNLKSTWPHLNLPAINTFLNTINLISTSSTSNIHSLLQLHYLNNQQIFLSYQNFFQQHSHF